MPTRINSLSLIRGLSSKKSCIAATTVNIAFTGLTQIDGVILSNGDRILVWQQSIPPKDIPDAISDFYGYSHPIFVDYLVVAGGAGGYRTGTGVSLYKGNAYAVKVGLGGGGRNGGGTGYDLGGGPGGTSVFYNITSAGCVLGWHGSPSFWLRHSYKYCGKQD